MRGFKIYVSIMLAVIAVATGILAAGAIWTALKLHGASAKVDNFNRQAQSIDATLKDIHNELHQGAGSLPGTLR